VDRGAQAEVDVRQESTVARYHLPVVVQSEIHRSWHSVLTEGETVGMIKVGDLVTAQGYKGAFRVRSFSKDQGTAEIELFNVFNQQSKQYRLSVPTCELSPFSEEASQADARIVGEAKDRD
jgi:hypothetical protein